MQLMPFTLFVTTSFPNIPAAKSCPKMSGCESTYVRVVANAWVDKETCAVSCVFLAATVTDHILSRRERNNRRI